MKGMFAGLPLWFRDVLTEADGITYDFLRVLACVGVLVFLVLACINHATFEPISFGTGFGAVLLAAGGAVRLNEGPTNGTPPAGPTTEIKTGSLTVNV